MAYCFNLLRIGGADDDRFGKTLMGVQATTELHRDIQQVRAPDPYSWHLRARHPRRLSLPPPCVKERRGGLLADSIASSILFQPEEKQRRACTH